MFLRKKVNELQDKVHRLEDNCRTLFERNRKFQSSLQILLEHLGLELLWQERFVIYDTSKKEVKKEL